MAFLNTILDIVFPSKCISCNEKGSYFCKKCILSCKVAEREAAPFIYPIFDYRNPKIKKAIWFIKYRGKKKIVETFAKILHDHINEELSELMIMENFQKPILIPIPLSRARYRERGFNQSQILCEEIIKINQNKYLDTKNNILFKNKETEHQARIKDRNTRLKNLSGSFEVKNHELIKGRNIILIDDVTTTGATLDEARKVLKKAGARKIIAFTIAH